MPPPLGLLLSDHYLLYVQLSPSGAPILVILWFHQTYKPLTIPCFHPRQVPVSLLAELPFCGWSLLSSLCPLVLLPSSCSVPIAGLKPDFGWVWLSTALLPPLHSERGWRAHTCTESACCKLSPSGLRESPVLLSQTSVSDLYLYLLPCCPTSSRSQFPFNLENRTHRKRSSACSQHPQRLLPHMGAHGLFRLLLLRWLPPLLSRASSSSHISPGYCSPFLSCIGNLSLSLLA